MATTIAFREHGGRLKQVEVPGFHDGLTRADIRKQFTARRGIQQKQLYLAAVMRSHPLQLIDSGLIALFDDPKAYRATASKIEWLHRLKSYSNSAHNAFNGLEERQQKVILTVLPEERSIEDAAKALRLSRKHAHNLFWKAIDRVFPEYQSQRPRPTLCLLRQQLAELMKPETSWREQSGNEEEYLENLMNHGSTLPRQR